MLLGLSVKAQKNVLDDAIITVKYRYIYINNLLLPEKKEAMMTLMIGKKWSLFYNMHNDNFYFENKDIDYSKYVRQYIDENGKLVRIRSSDSPRTLGPTEYTYLNREKMQETFIARVLFRGLYSYTDKYTYPKWDIEQEEKEILGYSCQMAVTNYLGRKWTAWFAKELPFNSGPWKLTGLPGLVLEAEDEEGHFMFIAISAEKPKSEDNVQIKMKDDLVLIKTTKDILYKLQISTYEGNGDFGSVQIKTSSPRIKRKLNTLER